MSLTAGATCDALFSCVFVRPPGAFAVRNAFAADGGAADNVRPRAPFAAARLVGSRSEPCETIQTTTTDLRTTVSEPSYVPG